MTDKITRQTFPKPKPNPLFNGMPTHLKNPANYLDIQRKILDTIRTNCSHGELLDYAKCKKCTLKMLERRKLLKRLGFKNPAQYMAWRAVHEEIKTRYPLVDWEKNKIIGT